MGFRTIRHQPSAVNHNQPPPSSIQLSTPNQSAPLSSNCRHPCAGIDRCLNERASGAIFPMPSRWQKLGKCRPRCKKHVTKPFCSIFRRCPLRPLPPNVDAHIFNARRTQRTRDITTWRQWPLGRTSLLAASYRGRHRRLRSQHVIRRKWRNWVDVHPILHC